MYNPGAPIEFRAETFWYSWTLFLSENCVEEPTFQSSMNDAQETSRREVEAQDMPAGDALSIDHPENLIFDQHDSLQVFKINPLQASRKFACL